MTYFLFMGQNFVIKNLSIISLLRTHVLLYLYPFLIFFQLPLSDAALPKFSRKVSFSAENMFFQGIFLQNILLQCPRHNFPDAAPEDYSLSIGIKENIGTKYINKIDTKQNKNVAVIYLLLFYFLCAKYSSIFNHPLVWMSWDYGTNYLEFTKSPRFTVKLTVFDSNLAILRKSSG